MKKFKKYFKKFIVCLLIVFILSSSVVSVFASMPDSPPYVKTRFNIQNENLTYNTFYRYYLEVYNWNHDDSSKSYTFSSMYNQYFFPYDTISSGEQNPDYMHRDLRIALYHVFDYYDFVSYSSLEAYYLDESILVYFDPSTLETVYLFFFDELKSGSPLGTYGNVSYSINAVVNGSGYDSSGNRKKVYNLVASNSSNNVVCLEYRISSRNANFSTYSYSLTKLSSTSFWLAPQNIIFASSDILNAFGGFDDTLFTNYYFKSYASYLSFAYVDALIGYNQSLADLNGFNTYSACREDPNTIDGYYIDFKLYMVGKFNDSFNWSRYCSTVDTFTINGVLASNIRYELLGVKAESLSGNRYYVYTLRKYFTYVPSSSVYSEYTISFYGPSNALQNYYNNTTENSPYIYFSFGQATNPDLSLNDYLNSITDSSAFAQQLLQRLYGILPVQVYAIFVATLAIVVTIALARLALHI